MPLEDVPLDEWLEGLTESCRDSGHPEAHPCIRARERSAPDEAEGPAARSEVTGFMGELGISLSLWPEVFGADETLRR